MERDPLERFKLVMVWYLASIHHTTGFSKPLNPILGETYQVRACAEESFFPFVPQGWLCISLLSESDSYHRHIG